MIDMRLCACLLVFLSLCVSVSVCVCVAVGCVWLCVAVWLCVCVDMCVCISIWTDLGPCSYARMHARMHGRAPSHQIINSGKLTQQEEESHMAIWCLMSSPLLAGNNLTSASADLIKILTAPGPISVNQDPLALQGQLCGHGTSCYM